MFGFVVRGAAPASAAVGLACWLCASAGAVRAEPLTASVSGTVRDGTGAAVPNAELVLRSLGTGVDRRSSSDSLGAYSFSGIGADRYVLTAGGDGFTETSVQPFALAQRQSATLDFGLEAGEAIEPPPASGWCDYRVIVEEPSNAPPPLGSVRQPHFQEPPLAPTARNLLGGDCRTLCECYSGGAGWRRPMELYLGEGAREHLPLIKRAARVWNDVLGQEVIEVKEDQVSYSYGPNPLAAGSFYSNDVSVIYMPTAGISGYNLSRQIWNSEGGYYEVVEADVFVNYSETERRGGDVLSLYSTILHELGHALGLGHIAIGGNVMSYERGKKIHWTLAPFFAFGLFPEYGTDPSRRDRSYFMFDPRYRPLVQGMVTPGEQDKLILSCLYSPSILSNFRQAP